MSFVAKMPSRVFGPVIACVLMAGCAMQPEPMTSASANVMPVSAVNQQAYRLGPRDQLRVIVFNETNLSGSFEVDATGGIALPLVGVVDVNQLTLREAEERLTEAFAQYLVEPRVSIEVEENRPFYIFGEVQRGGEFPYVANMHVLNAISMAGGFTPRANNRTIFLTRAGSQAEIAVPATSQTKIQPGDIVRVGERRF
ncbi:MAG: polysaccharide biosynthesis/export family protein [Alphaproteobacteria bacterium]